MSLFKGRVDVYAKRWKSKQKDTTGYSPSCLYEWKAGVCAKPKGTCAGCAHKAYAALDENVIEDHLLGKMVAGIYPMRLDETCWFLAIDFDDGEWQKDTSALRDVCAEFAIPVAVERSRSGNGAHAWFFFESPIQSSLARKIAVTGTSAELLQDALAALHELGGGNWKDRRLIAAAIAVLQQVRGEIVAPKEANENLDRIIEAADKVAGLSFDASEVRLAIDEVMRVWQRKWYLLQAVLPRSPREGCP